MSKVINCILSGNPPTAEKSIIDIIRNKRIIRQCSAEYGIQLTGLMLGKGRAYAQRDHLEFPAKIDQRIIGRIWENAQHQNF